MSSDVDEQIDCTGLFCPLPIVKTRSAIKKMAVGQVLEMTATDDGVLADVQAWTDQAQHELLVCDQRADGVYRFLIRKLH